MTGDYKLLIPSMWVSTLCFILCRKWKLYEKQVPSRLESPAHRGDFIVDVLEGIKVADVRLVTRQTIHESMTLREILHLLPESRQNYFPVLDDGENLVGIFSTDDIRSYLFDDSIWQLAVARDIMTTRLVTVTKEDDLNSALRRFTELNLDELPVIEGKDRNRKLIGMLRRKDAIGTYNRRLMERKQIVIDAAK